MKTPKPKKAPIIREMIALYPDEGPTIIAQKIREQHPGMKVSPQEISTARSKLRNAAAQPKSESVEFEKDVVSGIQGLKLAIETFGRDQAKKMLDVL